MHYKGKVWCIRVPSGAFVARRNGKVFVTGNSGFPKSLDVSKAIDKAAGAEREVVGTKLGLPGYSLTDGKGGLYGGGFGANGTGEGECKVTAPATEAAQQWQGWGTALKPALEPITVARKPIQGTVAKNVLEHGTGAINVDGCRVGTRAVNESGWSKTGSKASENRSMSGANYDREPKDEAGTGRWPANLIHDGSDEVVGLFPVTTSGGGDKHSKTQDGNIFKGLSPVVGLRDYKSDSGSAARFFYCAKASKRDRDEGLEGFEERRTGGMQATVDGSMLTARANIHPTVKPTDLMRYLCRLVTPPNGTILDPFMGSGSTGKAAVMEGFGFIGTEKDADYFQIAVARIKAAKRETAQLSIF